MENPITLLIIGGLISLVSSLAIIALQFCLDLYKQKHETRRYPTEVLYNKQTEFYDKAVQIFPKINSYITAVDVWLCETSPHAKQKSTELAKKTSPVWEFNELLEAYSMYLPGKILRAGNELFAECIFLSNSPTLKRTQRSIELLFSFRNIIRECVGIDRISADLLKSFGTHEREKQRQESN